MVLKRSKFGGNTGNTLRRIGTGELFSQQFYQAEYTIKETNNKRNCRNKKNISVNVNHIPTSVSSVYLSLNKKNSWDFPHLDNVKKDSNPSFAQSSKTPKSRRSRRKKINLQQSVKVFYIKETTKSFSRKTPRSSPYYTKDDVTLKEKSKKHYDDKHWKVDFYRNESDLDFFNNEYQEDNDHTSEYYEEGETQFISYEDYIANETANRNTSKSDPTQITSFIEEASNESDAEESQITSFVKVAERKNIVCENIQLKLDKLLWLDRKTKVQNVDFECDVDKSIICKSFLQKCYKELYVEGQSSPRRFLILKELKPNSPFVLINVLDHSHTLTSAKLKVSIVSDNTKIADHIKESVDLHALIKASLFSILSIGASDGGLPNTPFGHLQKSLKTTNRSNLLKHSSFYCTSNTSIVDDYFDDWQMVNANDARHQPYVAECGVCCDESKQMFTTLTACGHCFCDGCWNKYIHRNIANNMLTMKCLHYNCNSDIDLVTVCSFISPIEFYKYCKSVCNNYVSTKKHLKFCPSPGCENVACLPEAEIYENHQHLKAAFQVDLPLVSDCSQCGKSWCCNCGEKNHWPASCDSYKIYLMQREKDTGVVFDKNGSFITNFLPNLKRCPRCAALIEKTGGCNHMRCRCNADFCWVCLIPYSVHQIATCKMTVFDDYTSFFNDSLTVASLRGAMHYQDKSRGLWKKRFLGRVCKKYPGVKNSKRYHILKSGHQLLHASYRLIEMLCVCKACCHSQHQKANLENFTRKLKGYVTRLEEFYVNHKNPDFIPKPKCDGVSRVMSLITMHVDKLVFL